MARIESLLFLLLFVFTNLLIKCYGELPFELGDDRLIDKSKVELQDLCVSFPAFDGWFRFLGNKAEAYYLVQNGFIYFEYYFPQYMFTAISVSNQTNNGYNTGCLDCYDYKDPNANPINCLSECVGNNEFVITGQSDPTQDPLERWKIWEIDFTDSSMFLFLSYKKYFVSMINTFYFFFFFLYINTTFSYTNLKQIISMQI